MKNLNLPFHPRLSFGAHFVLNALTIAIVSLLLLLPTQPLQACMGTPVPPCGRSVFLAKFTPGVVVFPAGGGAINVPIGVLPFAWWNPTGLPNMPICPQPVAATLTLTLTCFPSGTVIGPQAFPVPIPTIPGAQPVAGPVNFVIPAGVFPAGSPPQICLVVGTYTVTFSDGVQLAFNGDTEVCIVPPTPLDAAVPRLDMKYLPTNGEDYESCRRGDQANLYFLIANNDPNETVSLDLNSIGRQISQLPEGFNSSNAYDNDVYSISLPEAGTDTYPAAFIEDLNPGELLKEPDPSMPDDQLLTKSFELQPCEAIIIGIAMRSFGMCANGSCNERLVKVEGTFANGDPALACASTLLVVDEAPAKSVLCEIADSVKVGEEGMATWSPGQYFGLAGDLPHSQTFAQGNLQSQPGFLTTGIASPDLFSATGSDYTRIDAEVTGMQYSVNFNSPQCDNGQNLVQIQGLNAPNFDAIALPIINFFGSTAPLEIIVDAQTNQLDLLVQGDIVFQGPLDLFLADPPPEFCIDPDMCRIIEKRSSFSDKSIFVEPPAVSRLFEIPNTEPGCDQLDVFDNNISEADWAAFIDGNGISLPNAMGTGELEFCYDDLSVLPEVPATTVAYIEVSCPNALASIRVPVAIRVKDTTVNAITPYPILEDGVVLYSPSPNPFTEITNIKYSLDKGSSTSLLIYNHLGQIVRHLQFSKNQSAGDFSIEWDGRDDAGNKLNPGLFICQLQADNKFRSSNIFLVY